MTAAATIVTPLTPIQREMARSALGLRVSKTSYRNYYTVPRGTEAHAAWSAMVEAGNARLGNPTGLPPDMDNFHLTRAGAEQALNPRETLCPEDFPA